MAWRVSGQMVEFCSCKMMCPCWFGPGTEPDQGWCAGAILYDVEQGQVDGIDVGGTKVVFAAEWPGNFFAGNGKARLYLDANASADQRRELEAVFSGQKGGLFEGLMGAVITEWLPAETARIDVSRGEKVSINVGEVGRATLQPLVDSEGRPTTVTGSAAQAAFQSASMQVASSQGTTWSDPAFHTWEGDSGTLHTFNWSA
jgi:hypothetical protein